MVLLLKGETIIQQGRGRIFDSNGQPVKLDGELYLTNMRIIFEREEGFFSKKRDIFLNFSIDSLNNVGVESKFLSGNYLTLQFKYVLEERVRQIEGQVSYYKTSIAIQDPSSWEEKIRNVFSR